VFKREVGHFEHKFQGEGGRPQTTLGVRKLVPGLSHGVVCVILRLAILIQYRLVTHTDTHTHIYRHAIMASTRASLAPCG